jgi:DHA1 family tetracycline resistance protein-like MFS transporter
LRLLRRHPDLTTLGLVSFASSLAGAVMPSTWVLYVTYRYHWAPGATRISLAVLGVISMIAQVVVIGRFVKRFGERVSLFAGTGFGALGLIACGSR